MMQTSSGWGSAVTPHQDAFKQAMAPYRGRTLRAAQINSILRSTPGLTEREIQWMMPSDHCVNHTNAGACTCAQTPQAIFERIGHGEYRVL